MTKKKKTEIAHEDANTDRVTHLTKLILDTDSVSPPRLLVLQPTQIYA